MSSGNNGLSSAGSGSGSRENYALDDIEVTELVTILQATLPGSAMASWRWRIPFLIAAPLGIAGLFVHLRLEESPAYEKQSDDDRMDSCSNLQQLKATVIEQWRPMLVCFLSTEPSTLPTLFPTSVRNGATSISFNLSVSAFGGTTPLVAAVLVKGTGDLLVPAYILIVAGVVGIVSVYFKPEPAGHAFKGSAPTAASEEEAREIASNP